MFIGHVDIERDYNGADIFAQVRTSGQKLKKIVLESLFTTVLYSKVVDGDYVFETLSNKSTAKSPMGLFADTVPNDLNVVINMLRQYEEE